jgi:hypothetical protein
LWCRLFDRFSAPERRLEQRRRFDGNRRVGRNGRRIRRIDGQTDDGADHRCDSGSHRNIRWREFRFAVPANVAAAGGRSHERGSGDAGDRHVPRGSNL